MSEMSTVSSYKCKMIFISSLISFSTRMVSPTFRKGFYVEFNVA